MHGCNTLPAKFSTDARAILSLVAVAVLLKVIVLLQHPILARDGIHHIKLAHELSSRSWTTVLQEQPFHPGYGFTLLVTSIIFDAISPGPLTPSEWQWCAHISSSLAGILLVLPLYGLARCFYSVRTAWLGCLCFLILPTVVQVTTDALTESWYLLFTLSALWALVHGVRSQRSSWFVLAGLFAGTGYLVRVEAIIIPATFVVFVLVWRSKLESWLPTGSSLRNLAILLACFFLPPLPYMMAIGKISNRPAVQTMAQAETTGNHQGSILLPRDLRLGGSLALPPLADVSNALLASQRLQDGVNGLRITSIQVLDALEVVVQAHMRAGNYFLWPLAALGLWLQLRYRRMDTGIALLLILLTLHSIMLGRLALTSGYTSERHTLLAVALSSFAAAVGMIAMHNWVKRVMPWLWDHRRVHTTIGLLLLLVLCVPSAIRPLHHSQESHRQAGLWLRKQMKYHRDQLVDPYGWATFYAGLAFSPKVTNRPDPRFTFGVIDPRDNDLNRIREWTEAKLTERVEGIFHFAPAPAVWNWPTVDKPKLIIRQRNDGEGLKDVFTF
jgi:hypothetical protein